MAYPARIRSHKSLGGSSPIGSPTTPTNGVSLVSTPWADGVDVAEAVVVKVGSTAAVVEVASGLAARVETAGVAVAGGVDRAAGGDTTTGSVVAGALALKPSAWNGVSGEARVGAAALVMVAASDRSCADALPMKSAPHRAVRMSRDVLL